MAANYSPYQIIQLLQVSVWRSRTTLDYSGFSKLSKSIIEHNLSNDHVDINQEYLNELHVVAKKAIVEGKEVSKNETYINAILAYNDCVNWKEFQEEAARCERFLDIGKIDFSKSEKEGVTLIYDQLEQEKLGPIMSFLKKNTQLPLNIRLMDFSQEVTISEEFEKCFNETPFLIWCISDQLNKSDQLSDLPVLEEHLASGQLIPIRLSGVLSERHLKASFLGKKPISSGLLGVYLSLVIIQQSLELFEDFSKTKESKTSKKSPSGFHIGENSGTVYQVKKVKGGNVTLTGSFNQNFYNKKK